MTRLVFAIVAAIFLGILFGGGCAGAPWLLGDPLDGKPAIPPTSRAETVADHRRKMLAARSNGAKVIEIAELSALEQRGALHADETKRFAQLLRERARDWVTLKRPIPLAEDLRHLSALEPSRARALVPALRAAERAAGDLWLALGENARAEEEYRSAERLGAGRMVFRLRAAWGASPADLEQDVLERALSDLPERALAPFTAAYLASGGSEPRVLHRAWSAARIYGPHELQARIESLPAAASFSRTGTEAVSEVAGQAPSGNPESDGTAAAAGAVAAGKPPRVTVVAPADENWLLSGPTLAGLLLPLCQVFPDLTAPGPRSRAWSDLLIAEDPTSPDSLEIAALIDARAGRIGGASRKLGDLVFYSPDRAEGQARAARVWERAGQQRRACLAWQEAANFGPREDPRWCEVIACVRRTPGAGDPEIVVHYVRERAPTLSCVAGPAGVEGSAQDGGNANGAQAPSDGGVPPDGASLDAGIGSQN
jgi:hypothetical protein